MEYGFEWYIPSRVLILKVSGDISLEDLARFNQSMIGYLEEGTAPVHLISTAGDIGHVPTNLMLIKETVSYLRHPHMGWTIVVQEKANAIAGFILSVATQATGMKMRLVKNVPDGLETLRRIDPSIDVQVPTTDEDFNRQ
jgi:hypothetical protein